MFKASSCYPQLPSPVWSTECLLILLRGLILWFSSWHTLWLYSLNYSYAIKLLCTFFIFPYVSTHLSWDHFSFVCLFCAKADKNRYKSASALSACSRQSPSFCTMVHNAVLSGNFLASIIYRYLGAYTRCQQLPTNQMSLPLISYLGS